MRLYCIKLYRKELFFKKCQFETTIVLKIYQTKKAVTLMKKFYKTVNAALNRVSLKNVNIHFEHKENTQLFCKCKSFRVHRITSHVMSFMPLGRAVSQCGKRQIRCASFTENICFLICPITSAVKNEVDHSHEALRGTWSAVSRFTAVCLHARNCAAPGKGSRPKHVDTQRIKALTFTSDQLTPTRTRHNATRAQTWTHRWTNTDVPGKFHELSLSVPKSEWSMSCSKPVFSLFDHSSPGAQESSEIRCFRETVTRNADAIIETTHAHPIV